jgi:hypothetical protein
MDPVSPVAQLVVAAISGGAFLLSMVVLPFPKGQHDATSVMAPLSFPSQAGSAASAPPRISFDQVLK